MHSAPMTNIYQNDKRQLPRRRRWPEERRLPRHPSPAGSLDDSDRALLEFEFPDCTRPKDLLINKDTRLLDVPV